MKPTFLAGIVPHRRKRKQLQVAEPPVALALVSATYDPDYAAVTLTFNQDINTDEMDLSAIEVNDAAFEGFLYRGFTTTGLTATSVTIEMESIGASTGEGVTMNVGAGNGIVAVSDGSEWAGVTDLVLPFG